ncbi:hypothetical protein MPER_09074, partial [Moniliophthora perniciosa FA553]
IIYSAISPSSTWTFVYGNYFYLCTSAYFWLGLVLLFVLSLTPRFIARAYQASLAPGDIDIVRYIKKNDPYADLSMRDSEVHLGIGLAEMKKRRNRVSRASSMADPLGVRSASRMDMSTGMLSAERGFDFATEENGPAIKRIQTNLSERRLSSRNLPAPILDSPGKKGKTSDSPGGGHSRMFSLTRSFKKKKPRTPPREEE